MYKKYHFSLLLITVMFSVTGCIVTVPVSDTAITLDVSFDWTNTSDCASTSPSPPITVSSIPDGTKYLKVTMVDLDNTSYPDGGGEIANNGSGIIPEGTINNYEGPCPPSGVHNYKITAQILKADNSLSIGRVITPFSIQTNMHYNFQEIRHQTINLRKA